MQLRLGFSLAAHLEPDVLLVDEAIAVGDAGFQYRCVERMRELIREGRTLVFVSHDMSAVETLCDRGILLESGEIIFDGPARDVVRRHLEMFQAERLAEEVHSVPGRSLEIQRVTVHDRHGNEVRAVETTEPLTVRLHYYASAAIRRPIFEIGISDGRIGTLVLASMLVDGESPENVEGHGFVECTFLELPLAPRVYEIWADVHGEAGHGQLVEWQRLGFFEVTGDLGRPGLSAVAHTLTHAPVRLPYRWGVSQNSPPPTGE
jgi:hypothetical protein